MFSIRTIKSENLFNICLLFLLTVISFSSYAQIERNSIGPKAIPPSAENPDGMRMLQNEDDDYIANYLPNVEYVRRGDRVLNLQILQPAPRKSRDPSAPTTTNPPRPVIVYVQGSAWFPQNLYTALPQLSDFAHRGYVVASVEYRPSTEAIAPAQVQDVLSAIRYLRANQKKYNIDPERMGIWGDSSGGHLAALTATSLGTDAFITEDNKEQAMKLKAVVDFYGPTDFREMANYPTQIDHNSPNSPESRVVGGPIQDEKYRAAVEAYNPISYVAANKALPPFLIMHGDVDALVPFNQSVLLYEALRLADKEVDFYKVVGAGHGVNFWTPSVLGIVADFFDKNLK